MQSIAASRTPTRLLLASLGWLVLLACLASQIRHGWTGFFFQDDFTFLMHYRWDLHPDQWLSVANFGRFVSRNLYWWSVLGLAGPNPKVFLLLNLLWAVLAAVLWWRFLTPLSSRIAMFGAWLWLVSGATMANVVWASNSQHLLAHVFLAGYMCIVSAWHRSRHPAWALASIPVFMLGLGANALMAVGLSWSALCLVHARAGKGSAVMAGAWATQAAMVVVLLRTLAPTQTGAYEVAWSWHVFSTNLEHYYGHAGLAMLGLAWLTWQAWLHWRSSDPLRAWLMLAPLLCLLPFLPLVHQRYLNYAALSYFFLLTALLSQLSLATGRSRHAIACAFLLLGLMALHSSYRQHVKAWRHPMGTEQRAQVLAMSQAIETHPQPPNTRICVLGPRQASAPQHEATPPFWIQLGHGSAFAALVDDRLQYAPAPSSRPCKLTIGATELYPSSPKPLPFKSAHEPT